jgi:hypothetical protein
MAKFQRFMDIDETSKTRNNWRLAKEELVERGEAMARMISYAVAKEAFDALLEEIPADNDYEELRKALKLVEVGGPRKGKGASFAIYIPVKGRRIKKIDVSKTVIYVRAKKGVKPPAEDVLILEQNSPWTADTIPFWPKKSEGLAVQRKTTKREADAVAKEKKKLLPKLLHQFKELGRNIKLPKPGSPGFVSRNAKAVPDLAMQALNLEFGHGDVKSRPVFRKVFRSAKQNVVGLPERFQQIKDALTDPNSKSYKNWPKRMDKIPMGQARTFMGFQKRLGIR